LAGHTNAVIDLNWSVLDDSKIVTCSADKSLSIFDVNAMNRVKRLQGHMGIVNSCHVTSRGAELIISGSDDRTVKLWDSRDKTCVQTWPLKLPVTSVCIDEFGTNAYIGGIDSVIQIWDTRRGQLKEVLQGHTNSITSLTLSPDGSYLLSNSMDETLRCWDVRPYVQKTRCVKIYEGVAHSYEKGLLRCSWASDGSAVSAGCSDRQVHIWDSATRQKTHSLTGHTGCVYDVQFHPDTNIIASCSADTYLILGYY
jgi:Prp8 binding protein